MWRAEQEGSIATRFAWEGLKAEAAQRMLAAHCLKQEEGTAELLCEEAEGLTMGTALV